VLTITHIYYYDEAFFNQGIAIAQTLNLGVFILNNTIFILIWDALS
jgi:hypothetical protein